MDANGLMFGLFHMTMIVDLGHLAPVRLGIIGALSGAKAREFILRSGLVFDRRRRSISSLTSVTFP